MARGVAWYLVAPLVALGLVGCRFPDFEEREPWRAEAEEQCIARGLIQSSAYMEAGAPLNGNGVCGMARPFKIAAVNGGFVALAPRATLACPLVANIEAWFHEAIQPAAMAWYGSPVMEIKQISAYSCRTMNGQPGAAISEHAFGNALDIASFRFADGREVNFKEGWKGRPEERGFLRAVHAAACERFSTVLAPGADMFHYDHIHVDLARRASGRMVCNPAPMTLTPPPPRQPESIPVARMPAPSPWAQAAPPPTYGPSVIAREQAGQQAGPPLKLGNRAPPPNTFQARAPIADRVRQALGIHEPVYPPPPNQPNPYGLVPPGRIPNASLGADPVVTGSIGGAARKPDTAREPAVAGKGTNLLSAQPIADQEVSSEPASVFNLPNVRNRDD